MQIKEIEKITDHPHLNLFSVKYQDKLGRDKTWIFASRASLENPLQKCDRLPDAVVVVPFHTKENKLVIIKEFRVVLGRYQYGFPAGLLDPGEGVIQAGKRELHEETGLTLTRVLAEGPAVYSSSGMTDESVSLLYAECEGIPSYDHTGDSEDIQAIMLSQEDAGRLLNEPDNLFDVKTWVVLKTFAAHGVL